MAEWVYAFRDMVTDAELAVLPMVGVDFEKVLNGTGKLEGVIPTSDPRIRALDPWGATQPRRCAVYVHYGELLLWGGVVWTREMVQDTPGIKITAGTFESWLATQYPLADYTFTAQTAAAMVARLLTDSQAVRGGRLGSGFTVRDGNPGAAATTRARTWPRTDLKSVLDRAAEFVATQTPIEWRIDLTENPDGTIAKTLLLGEPRIGRPTSATDLYVWYSSVGTPGTLVSFDDTEDGTVQGNAAAGTVHVTSSSTGVSGTDVQLWSYQDAAGNGYDEVGAGYPLMMHPVTSTQANINTQADLDDAVAAQVLDSLSQGKSMTNFAVRFDDPPLASYDVGDDLDLHIQHPSYPEWPGVTVYSVRILGRKITPRQGSTPDQVSLTVVNTSSGRLPRTTTLVAHMRDLTRRISALETA